MTLIVGVIGKGKVFIGGDSAGVAGLNVVVRKDPKVFKVGDFIIGCTSSFRMIQLLRFSLILPKVHDKDIYEYMCTSFIDAVRGCFKSGGFARKESEKESGGTFLVAYGNRLFKIEGDYQVAEHTEQYAACGCGESFALGALDMMSANLIPIEKIKKALQVGVNRSGGVRPPFIILST